MESASEPPFGKTCGNRADLSKRTDISGRDRGESNIIFPEVWAFYILRDSLLSIEISPGWQEKAERAVSTNGSSGRPRPDNPEG
jgi:hypothetical protein